jgi:membrane-associated phospholipid phosphatase
MRFRERLLDIRYSAPVALILVLLSVQFWDLPLAAWIATYPPYYVRHLKNSEIPDLLLAIIIILTALSWAMYLYLIHQNIRDRRTQFLRVLGTAMPLTFVAKEILKWIFGRVNTRTWLKHPDLDGFHWFDGSKHFQGFPSGHMLVFTPLFLALWQFFPRYRLYYGIAWFSLAIALIATEYHFLGDVLAGAFIGVVVYLTVSRAVL